MSMSVSLSHSFSTQARREQEPQPPADLRLNPPQTLLSGSCVLSRPGTKSSSSLFSLLSVLYRSDVGSSSREISHSTGP